ncbi:hypothetical protein, partial [Winogradskyella aquimaris]
MYKNNSGLIAQTKVSNYKKGLCLTEKLVRENPLLFLYKTVVCNLKNELQMKNMILSFLILLIVSSCTNTEKLTELENRIAKIEN